MYSAKWGTIRRSGTGLYGWMTNCETWGEGGGGGGGGGNLVASDDSLVTNVWSRLSGSLYVCARGALTVPKV